MWKTIALAVVALAAPGVVQGVVHGIFQTPNALARNAPQAPAPGKAFAPRCRGDQLLDSRPDPAWVGQSFAGDHCRAPALPVAIDGTHVSRAQIVAAMAAVKDYQAVSDGFARCIGDFVAARAASIHPLSPAQLVIENHRVLVASRAKQRVQGQVNGAVEAFNAYGSDCGDHG